MTRPYTRSSNAQTSLVRQAALEYSFQEYLRALLLDPAPVRIYAVDFYGWSL